MNPNTYRPKFAIYHPNGRGNGSALALELIPAGNDSDNASGHIAATLAPQATLSGGGRGFATFDWNNAVAVRFDATELGKILQVFHGETESIDDGKGLYHRSAKAATVVRMSHILEPVQGYDLEIVRADIGDDGHADNERARKVHITITPPESLAIAHAIEGALTFVAFGIPQIIRPTKTNG